MVWGFGNELDRTSRPSCACACDIHCGSRNPSDFSLIDPRRGRVTPCTIDEDTYAEPEGFRLFERFDRRPVDRQRFPDGLDDAGVCISRA
jgi:hypothetical protein